MLELEFDSKKFTKYREPTPLNFDFRQDIKKVQKELDAKINNVYDSFQEKYVDIIE